MRVCMVESSLKSIPRNQLGAAQKSALLAGEKMTVGGKLGRLRSESEQPRLHLPAVARRWPR